MLLWCDAPPCRVTLWCLALCQVAMLLFGGYYVVLRNTDNNEFGDFFDFPADPDDYRSERSIAPQPPSLHPQHMYDACTM